MQDKDTALAEVSWLRLMIAAADIGPQRLGELLETFESAEALFERDSSVGRMRISLVKRWRLIMHRQFFCSEAGVNCSKVDALLWRALFVPIGREDRMRPRFPRR